MRIRNAYTQRIRIYHLYVCSFVVVCVWEMGQSQASV